MRLFAFLNVFLFSLLAIAQTNSVSGVVNDSHGFPIIGATVIVDGTGQGMITDTDGRFSIEVSDNDKVTISYIGYVSQTFDMKGVNSLNVVLQEDVENLGEVVVVAFGTANKVAFTGSAKVINSDEIAKSQTPNVAERLSGKVAGVQMVNSSGQPGSSPQILIRGIGSINADTRPLWVVDGVPYDGDINNINPSDITSMTVLKDAASNALYGARGANGVVMITTKKPGKGDASVTVDYKIGMNSRALQSYATIDNPAMYYEMHYLALKNNLMSLGYSDYDAHVLANSRVAGPAEDGGLGYQVFDVPLHQNFIGINGKLNPQATLGRVVNSNGKQYYLAPDNLEDCVFRTSMRQEVNVALTQANDRGSIYNSYGYLDNQGIVANSNMKRFTARLKADYKIKNWLKAGANVLYTNTKYDVLANIGSANSSSNLFAYVANMAPIYPLYVRDGDKNVLTNDEGVKLYDCGDGMNLGLVRAAYAGSNAYGDTQLNINENDGNAVNANAYLDFTLYDNLSLLINGGLSFDETRSTMVNNPYFGQLAPDNGIVSKSHYRVLTYNLQQILKYNICQGQHSVNFMLGHEYYNDKFYSLGASKSNMFSRAIPELDGAIYDRQQAYSSLIEYNNEGFFARAQYDYDSKYFGSGSYRRDASSRFHPDNRWGNFWSVGGAWIISKEDFMIGIDWVDMLKAKSSIGSQGNDMIGNHRYTDLYQVSNSGGDMSLVFVQKGNKDITWETNINFNVGVEFELLKNRVSGGVEYFNRSTSNMLFNFPVATSLGYASYYANVGDMRNRGVELDLSFAPIRNEYLQWYVNLNLTHVKNRITMLPDLHKTIEVDGYKGFTTGGYFFGEGLPTNTFYLKRYAGVSESGESLWYQEKDGKTLTTNVHSEADYYLCGDPTPDLFGGFGISLLYKGFDFSVNFSYQVGGLVYDSAYASFMSSPTAGHLGMNYHKDLLDAWTPSNSISDIPRLQYGDSDTGARSDRFLTNASYLNLQNVNIGYSLPKRVLKKLKLKNLRVALMGDNLYYVSARQGLDPRYSFSGLANNTTYSPIRSISANISFKF